MITFTNEQKQSIVSALLDRRQNFGGTDAQFAKQWAINSSVYSTLKGGKIDGLLRDAQWLNMSRELGITTTSRKWNIAVTDVYRQIEEDVAFCKAHAKSMNFCDDTETGKTTAAKHLAKILPNCFYVDASQGKTKIEYIRLLARTIGVDENDKYVKVKANIKYALNMLPNPIVIVDEFGDLEDKAILEQKELENATVGGCGWYLMGADGFRAKMERGMSKKKVGYAELFSRHGKKFQKSTPVGTQNRIDFYKKLITDALTVNIKPEYLPKLPGLVKQCIEIDTAGNIGGLRRAESLLILNNMI